jgi:hypothetical protein
VASYGGVRSGNRGQKWRLQGTEGTPNISELLAVGGVDASSTNMLLTSVALPSSAHRNNLRRTSDREESSSWRERETKIPIYSTVSDNDSDQTPSSRSEMCMTVLLMKIVCPALPVTSDDDQGDANTAQGECLVASAGPAKTLFALQPTLALPEAV